MLQIVDKSRLISHSFALTSHTKHMVRKLSDMAFCFSGGLAEDKDPIIYEVFENQMRDLSCAFTRILPGKIGGEFFMTKGHFHTDEDASEIYHFLSGRGLILIQKDNKCKALEVEEGQTLYIPPLWAHRAINIGNKVFSFLAVYRSNAGHDFDISKKGFLKIAVSEKGKYCLKDNKG